MQQQAKLFAEKAHQGQKRKNSNTPYITHPIRVADRLKKAGCCEALICAGYLHDVVEDTPITIEDIKDQFGAQVAALVAAHTEDKTKSWQERKQHTIATIKYAEKEVKYLIVADKLDNLLGLEKDLQNQGEEVWQHFNAGPDKQKWYYESIAEYMCIGLDEKDIPDYFKEYEKAVQRVFETGGKT